MQDRKARDKTDERVAHAGHVRKRKYGEQDRYQHAQDAKAERAFAEALLGCGCGQGLHDGRIAHLGSILNSQFKESTSNSGWPRQGKHLEIRVAKGGIERLWPILR